MKKMLPLFAVAFSSFSLARRSLSARRSLEEALLLIFSGSLVARSK